MIRTKTNDRGRLGAIDGRTIFGVVFSAAVIFALLMFFRAGPPAPEPNPLPDPNPAPIVPGKRLRLVIATMKGCPACLAMERKTLSDPAVAKAIADRFTVEKVGPGDAKFKVAGYPTYIILASDGQELQRESGYQSPEKFLAWLNKARAAEGTEISRRRSIETSAAIGKAGA